MCVPKDNAHWPHIPGLWTAPDDGNLIAELRNFGLSGDVGRGQVRIASAQLPLYSAAAAVGSRHARY